MALGSAESSRISSRPQPHTQDPGLGGPQIPHLGGRSWTTALALGVWALLILATHYLGQYLARAGKGIFLDWGPLLAKLEPHFSPRVIVAVALAAVAVAWGPRVALFTPFRWLVMLTILFGTGWATALAWVDGSQGLTGPLLDPNEYLASLHLVQSPVQFLQEFTERIGEFPTHFRSHPPGMVLLLWGLIRAGMSSPTSIALIIITVGASAAGAVMVTLKEVAGEDRARRAAPFLALAPAAVWIATSADALFAGVGAWAVALLVLSTGNARRPVLAALVGGVLFGIGLFLTYGFLLLAAVPLTVALARRRLKPLIAALPGIAVVVAAFVLVGFWWLDGLGATRDQYFASPGGGQRLYGFFLFSNLAALAIALGPATAVGLARLRDRKTWLLVGGAGVAVIAANLSGMSRGEVERIWLPFMPWLLAANSALPGSGGSHRPSGLHGWRVWLALQAICALAIQLLFFLPW